MKTKPMVRLYPKVAEGIDRYCAATGKDFEKVINKAMRIWVEDYGDVAIHWLTKDNAPKRKDLNEVIDDVLSTWMKDERPVNKRIKNKGLRKAAATG